MLPNQLWGFIHSSGNLATADKLTKLTPEPDTIIGQYELVGQFRLDEEGRLVPVEAKAVKP